MKKKICLLAVSSFMLLAACGNGSNGNYFDMPKGGKIENLGETAGIETVAKSIADMAKNTLEALENPSEEKITFNDVSFKLGGQSVWKEFVYGEEVNGVCIDTYTTNTEASLNGSIESGNNGVFNKALKDMQAYAKVNDLSVAIKDSSSDTYEYSEGYDGEKYENFSDGINFAFDDINFGAYYDKGAIYLDFSKAENTIKSIFETIFGEEATIFNTITDTIYEETNGKIAISENLAESEIGDLVLNIDELIGAPIDEIFAPFYNINEETMAMLQSILNYVAPIITFKTYDNGSFATQITFNADTLASVAANIVVSQLIDGEVEVSEEEIAQATQAMADELKEAIGKFDFNFVLKTDAKKRLDSIGIRIDADVILEDDESGEDFVGVVEDGYYYTSKQTLKISGEISLDVSYGKMSEMPKFNDYKESATFETAIGELISML